MGFLRSGDFQKVTTPRNGMHPAIIRELRTHGALLMMCVVGFGSILYVFVPVEWINEAYADLGDGK